MTNRHEGEILQSSVFDQSWVVDLEGGIGVALEGRSGCLELWDEARDLRRRRSK